MGWVLATVLILSSAFVGAAQSTAAKLPTKPPSGLLSLKPAQYILCQNKKDVRTIRVEKKNGGDDEWRTVYTRGGVDHEVAHGRYLVTCKKVMNNIKTNLEKARWSCRDISSVSMTDAK